MTTALAIPLPRPQECLGCYLRRAIDQHGCDGTSRMTSRWSFHSPLRADRVLAWAESEGGLCDCEVLANALHFERTELDGVLLDCGVS